MFFWNSLAISMIQWMVAICSLVPLPFLKLAWTTTLLSWYIMTFNYRATKNLDNFYPVHRKAMTKLDSILKDRDITFANKGLSSQGYGFSSGHVWMWELDYKESWAPKNWWFWTVLLEKTLESPLGCKEIQPIYPKGNQSWIFIGRTDIETETPVLWLPDAKNWLIWKDPDSVKDWRWEEKGTTEDEMVGWHHWLNGHVFE